MNGITKAPPERKVCVCCKQNRRLEFFTKGRAVCKPCFAGQERIRRECGNNAQISRLLRWPALLLIVTGIFQYDYVSGQGRICVYETIAGQRAVTINAMKMCPATWAFEI